MRMTEIFEQVVTAPVGQVAAGTSTGPGSTSQPLAPTQQPNAATTATTTATSQTSTPNKPMGQTGSTPAQQQQVKSMQTKANQIMGQIALLQKDLTKLTGQ